MEKPMKTVMSLNKVVASTLDYNFLLMSLILFYKFLGSNIFSYVPLL